MDQSTETEYLRELLAKATQETALLKIENEKLKSKLQYLKTEPLNTIAETQNTWPEETGV